VRCALEVDIYLGYRPEPYIYRYVRCIYGIYGRKSTIHRVIYGADIRFWPTLCILVCKNCKALTVFIEQKHDLQTRLRPPHTRLRQRLESCAQIARQIMSKHKPFAFSHSHTPPKCSTHLVCELTDATPQDGLHTHLLNFFGMLGDDVAQLQPHLQGADIWNLIDRSPPIRI